MHVMGSWARLSGQPQSQRQNLLFAAFRGLTNLIFTQKIKSDNKSGNSKQKAHSTKNRKINNLAETVNCQRGATGCGCGRALQGHSHARRQ